MKVYKKIVIEIETGETLYEDSYEYRGPVELLKGGGGEAKETDQEKELAKISKEQWNQYETRFKPFENEWIKNIEMTEGDQAQIAGQVNAGVGTEFDKLQKDTIKQQFNSGVDPSSGRFKEAITGLSENRGKATAKARTAASQATDDQTYQGLQSAIAMGRGQSAEATRDMTTLAADATNKSIYDQYNDQRTSQMYGSTAMTAAGMGLAGWQNRNKSSLLPVSELQANGEE